MYKVLIVDDERIIREGMSQMIKWDEHNLILVGAAENGMEAYEIIQKETPQIVITDIKMPGMNGLELIAKVKEILPYTVFVILSGYGEFDYANKAMQFGVRHYLLKPCDENEIISVLESVATELEEIKNREGFYKDIQYKFKKVLPQVKEQFLNEFIITKRFSSNDCIFFKSMFHISDSRLRLLLLKIEKESEFIEKFALKNISEEIIGLDQIVLSTILGENVILLINTISMDLLYKRLNEAREAFIHYYGLDLSIGVSEEDCFEHIPLMYMKAQECVKYSFYLGEGSIISKNDIEVNKGEVHFSLGLDYEKAAMSVKAGNVEEAKAQIKEVFNGIEAMQQDIDTARTYSMELYLEIIRQGAAEDMNDNIKKVIMIHEMKTLKQIFDFISQSAIEITERNFVNTSRKQSKLIHSVIQCINENIRNAELSLTWIAKEILYMNEDYLGKLFTKETNEKFSQYVMRVRIEMSKKLLISENDYKMYEISEMTGFADNTQYFSQVFKKYTGLTPSEYKKSANR